MRLIPRANRPVLLVFSAGVMGLGALSLSLLSSPEPPPAEVDGYNVARISTPIVLASRSDETAPLRTAALSPADEEAPRTGQITAGPMRGRDAWRLNVDLLEQARTRLQSVSGYTATFYRREVVAGSMGEPELMEMKLRHAPYSVYLKWIVGDKGRELLFVDGQNDGEMLVHPGGWKARLFPALKIDPNGAVARSESRHPITDIGLLHLTERLLIRRRNDRTKQGGVTHEKREDCEVNDRQCHCFVTTYHAPKYSDYYRKSIVFIDCETHMPIAIQNYTWPEQGEEIADPARLDEATLIEHYSYTDLQLELQLADSEFDRGNTNYHFRR